MVEVAIASGSNLTSMIAGWPEATARSNAGANSSDAKVSIVVGVVFSGSRGRILLHRCNGLQRHLGGRDAHGADERTGHRSAAGVIGAGCERDLATPVGRRSAVGHDVLDGFYDAAGSVPCQIDGGLKCFGHPIGASGLRMIYEIYLQMQGRAGERQRKELPRAGLTHNLGGFPHQNVCSISIIGRYGN